MAAGEEAVVFGSGAPVFVNVARVAQKAVIAETLQVAVFDSEARQKYFIIVNAWEGFGFGFNLVV